MSDLYFSDRERGTRPRTAEEISATVWMALVHIIQSRIDDGSFGYKFPGVCPDGAGISGSDARKFRIIARSDFLDLPENWMIADAEAMPDR